ncbi:uncharacterized protein LOC118437982 isoform X2 [Folsomia candida]|uniref:uncharacterized protein LOC118437982 isoform X2 n=1 Tax=Folsomia candida TaxID=158441 RepID=UPI0016050A83|nr:uncharacterized protein LOC118437982 isoform X2 [Folsomia candida]
MGVFVGMGIAAAILVCGIVATVVIRRWWCRRELWRDRRLVNKEVFRKVVVSSPGQGPIKVMGSASIIGPPGCAHEGPHKIPDVEM